MFWGCWFHNYFQQFVRDAPGCGIFKTNMPAGICFKNTKPLRIPQPIILISFLNIKDALA
jgi:hypothetical protein